VKERILRKSELQEKIDETILRKLEICEPTVDEVASEFLQLHQDLVQEYAYSLAVSHIHTMISNRMKKILATIRGHALQLRLDITFDGLEPESAITFRDANGQIRYVATARATEEHHRRYIELLRDQIRADKKKLKVAEYFYKWLEPVFKKFPGIRTAEAVEILRQEGQAA